MSLLSTLVVCSNKYYCFLKKKKKNYFSDLVLDKTFWLF